VDIAATVTDLLDADPLPGQHGQSLRPYLESKRMASPRDHIFSEYLENEEATIRTARWNFIHCSGKRERGDGYKTDNPTPGRYVRLYDLEKDPGEFTDVARKHPDVVTRLESLMLDRFRKTHPDAPSEPPRLSIAEAIDWYLRPRDA
jgi:arylsulfatase A-like enzyme